MTHRQTMTPLLSTVRYQLCNGLTPTPLPKKSLAGHHTVSSPSNCIFRITERSRCSAAAVLVLSIRSSKRLIAAGPLGKSSDALCRAPMSFLRDALRAVGAPGRRGQGLLNLFDQEASRGKTLHCEGLHGGAWGISAIINLVIARAVARFFPRHFAVLCIGDGQSQGIAAVFGWTIAGMWLIQRFAQIQITGEQVIGGKASAGAALPSR